MFLFQLISILRTIVSRKYYLVLTMSEMVH